MKVVCCVVWCDAALKLNFGPRIKKQLEKVQSLGWTVVQR